MDTYDFRINIPTAADFRHELQGLLETTAEVEARQVVEELSAAVLETGNFDVEVFVSQSTIGYGVSLEDVVTILVDLGYKVNEAAFSVYSGFSEVRYSVRCA